MQRADEIVGGPGSADDIRGVVADVVRAPETARGRGRGGARRSARRRARDPARGRARGDRLPQAGRRRAQRVRAARVVGDRAVAELVAEPGAADAGGGARTFEGEGGAASWMSSAWDPAGGVGGDGDESPGVAPAPAPARAAAAARSRSRTAPQLVAAAIAVRRRGGDVVAGEGVLGRMSDLVAFADGYDEVGKRLLGSTVVVEDLDRALQLHDQGVTDRLVTLDGDVVDEDGVVAGGSRDAQGAGVLAQKREIRDLEEIVGQLEHDLSEAMTRLVTRARPSSSRSSRRSRGCARRSTRATSRSWATRRTRRACARELERHRDRLGQLGTEQLELEERLRAIAVDEAGDARARARAPRRGSTSSSATQLDLHRGGQRRIATGSRSSRRSLTEARIRAAQLGEKRAAAEASALRLQRTDAELAARAERLGARDRGRGAPRGDAARGLRSARGRARRACASGATPRSRALDEGRLGYQHAAHRADRGRARGARAARSRPTGSRAEVDQLELRNGQVAMHPARWSRIRSTSATSSRCTDDRPRLPPARAGHRGRGGAARRAARADRADGHATST